MKVGVRMLLSDAARRSGAVALALTTCLGTGLTGTARRADASLHDSWQVPALQPARVSAPMPKRLRLEESRFKKDEDTTSPPAGGDVERAERSTVTLHMTGDEAVLLRKMLHEAVTNDLDLLEDTLYQSELVDSEAVARIALAIRLDVGMG